MAGKYTRSPERGFRKMAMAFWRPSNSGLIYGNMDIDVTKALAFQDAVYEKFGVKPSMGQILGKGIALSLKKTPEGNAKIIWGQSYIKDTVDVYFQVDMQDGKDLSGVVVPDTANKTIVEVSRILRDRAKRLRSGKDEQYEKTQKGCLGKLPSWVIRRLLGVLTFFEYNLGITPTWLGATPEPFGTVMVTNVSSFGIDTAYAPLVPVSRVPFVALMGKVKKKPWVDENDQLCVRPILNASATFDHRLLDGNKIGRIVRFVVRYMTNPFIFEGPGLDMPDPFSPADAKKVEAAKGEAATAEAATAEAATAEAATAEAATAEANKAEAPKSEETEAKESA